MKKILYIELLPNNFGNHKVDEHFIECLSRNFEVTFVNPKEWKIKVPESVKVYNISVPPEEKLSKKEYICRAISNLRLLKKLDGEQKFDYIFAASFETYVMSLLPFFVKEPRKRLYIFYHNNLDGIDKKRIKCFFWQTYKKRVNHLVFEESFAEHLRTYHKIDKKAVHVIPHPINPINQYTKKKYELVGLSNSNSEEWIKSIIEVEKRTGILKKSGLHILLRSKQFKFDDGNLKIFTGFLEQKEYDYYISSAKTIFLPYPPTFVYRMSGVMVDAFSNDTAVIGSDILLFREYAKKYPEICSIATSAMDIIDRLKTTNDQERDLFGNFKKSHSQEEISKKMEEIFL